MHLPLLPPSCGDPVVAHSIRRRELLAQRLRQGNWQRGRLWRPGRRRRSCFIGFRSRGRGNSSRPALLLHSPLPGICIGEEAGQMRFHFRRGGTRRACRAGFDGEAHDESIHGSIGLHLGRVDIELAAPDQLRLLALRHDSVEETAEDLQAVARPDAGQAGMVRQELV